MIIIIIIIIMIMIIHIITIIYIFTQSYHHHHHHINSYYLSLENSQGTTDEPNSYAKIQHCYHCCYSDIVKIIMIMNIFIAIIIGPLP
jgi:hypothetical protein